MSNPAERTRSVSRSREEQFNISAVQLHRACKKLNNRLPIDLRILTAPPASLGLSSIHSDFSEEASHRSLRTSTPAASHHPSATLTAWSQGSSRHHASPLQEGAASLSDYGEVFNSGSDTSYQTIQPGPWNRIALEDSLQVSDSA